ncbi:MAG: hypothetical protein KGM47_01705, partial [Acidobacteriota bacterium]|nr:hypothetical protein [Acidobacteriota bacterium]
FIKEPPAARGRRYNCSCHTDSFSPRDPSSAAEAGIHQGRFPGTTKVVPCYTAVTEISLCDGVPWPHAGAAQGY